MHLSRIPKEVIVKIVYYIDKDIDFKNFLTINKEFYKLYNYLFKLREIQKIKHKEIKLLFKEYYDLEIKNKKKYPNIKSYMFCNTLNPFKNEDYHFICKIYLDEIIGCNYLPKIGYLKFYLGYINIDGVFPAKIKYKKNIKKKETNKFLIKNRRKYILINKKYSLPLSYMRNLYIDKNLDTLAINDDPVIYNNEKFSDKYLFGFKTYYEDDPIKTINNIEENNNWIVILTLDPRYVFLKKNISKEMISFVIKEEDLKNLNFENVFAIYSKP